MRSQLTMVLNPVQVRMDFSDVEAVQAPVAEVKTEEKKKLPKAKQEEPVEAVAEDKGEDF